MAFKFSSILFLVKVPGFGSGALCVCVCVGQGEVAPCGEMGLVQWERERAPSTE